MTTQEKEDMLYEFNDRIATEFVNIQNYAKALKNAEDDYKNAQMFIKIRDSMDLCERLAEERTQLEREVTYD